MQKKQNYTLFFGGLLIMCALAVPLIALSQNLGLDMAKNAGTRAGYDGSTGETTFATTIGTAVRVLLSFVGIIFTVLTVYAGILWMTAHGNESQVETAKKTLQNSIIGLLIAIGSYSISGFVIRAFETGSSAAGTSPTGNSNQCCVVCKGGIICNFNSDDIIGVFQLPPGGSCAQYRDDFSAECDGNCTTRTKTGAGCSAASASPK